MMFDTFPLRQVVVVVFLLLGGNIVFGQQVLQADAQNPQRTELKYRGQFSAWGGYASGSEWPVMVGARYLPQLNLEVPIKRLAPGGDSGGGFWGGLRFDAEVSGNIYGSGEILPFSQGREVWDARWEGKVKLYRGWGRLSSDRAEVRVGLQKINFGSAMMLRPLMWFDSMDPRDPLQMTDGVWGALGRYYFSNNANVWVWGLLRNSARRALDVVPSEGGVPEFGGRVQVPVGKGEVAFTFHRRKTDVSGFGYDVDLVHSTIDISKLYENKYGLDMRFDYEIGFWLEASWINRQGEKSA